ncbi:hypothetical protein TVAG_119510 [Trichomonas vaginalis G3]|uniref:Uncharacterized protein n=1 Tax=Trichomonas vaginalis (strain ATCC PRA-98 / G3) TaxID=412133 RepID=A2D797_TRIV3|nr:bifunctional inhibitor/lipid-transfer protein/seed storage 2s albumin superfamily protein family [Trichomonas vaginalis G3]EAY23614.1 hypothetical protein TVAG_119510 [Trichomonas vaginalis G3]KAI5490107.1 bifunctional inhibitor/lipid-transfer protein/seed storage 2s albumin superfamily protein family [Trichomonas vaginalis G3]|eukprot:XP_001276862.1 hypothetical protein [Trichomonas vaginalis G3]
MFAIFLTLVAGATYEVTSLLQTFTLSGSLMGTSTLQSNSGPAIYYLLTCRATSYALTAYDSGGASYTIPVDTQSNNAYYVPYPRSRLECRVPILNQDTIIAICGLTGCENGLHFLERSPIIVDFQKSIPPSIMPIYPNHKRCIAIFNTNLNLAFLNNLPEGSSSSLLIENARTWTTMEKGQIYTSKTQFQVLLVKLDLGDFSGVPDYQINFTSREQAIQIYDRSFYEIPFPTPAVTPVDTPFITMYETPYETNSITPIETPYTTVYQTYATTPLITPHTTPYITQKTTPYETVEKTPFTTFYKTPFSTVEKTPFSTAYTTPIITPRPSNGGTPAPSDFPTPFSTAHKTAFETPYSTVKTTPSETDIPATPAESPSTYIKTPRWTAFPSATPYEDEYDQPGYDPNPIIVEIKETHPPIQTEFVKTEVPKVKAAINIASGTALIVVIVILTVINIIRNIRLAYKVIKGDDPAFFGDDGDEFDSLSFSYSYDYSTTE